MCDHDRAVFAAPGEACGSRRRKLWDMPNNCHCPIVGVCLPLGLLRKLVGKAAAQPVQGDDYDLHVWAVHECINRTRMAELLQRTLDERFAPAVRRFKGARDGAALMALWRAAVDSGDTAGAFWAALSHPRCDAWLTEAVVRDMHMIQHQAGASVRVDLGRFAVLQKQNALLAAELEQTRDKAARAAETRARDAAREAGQAAQLRAELAQRDAAIASLQHQLQALQAALPAMRDRTPAAPGRGTGGARTGVVRQGSPAAPAPGERTPGGGGRAAAGAGAGGIRPGERRGADRPGRQDRALRRRPQRQRAELP